MHSLLLVGPYDWDAELMPREEFEERIQAFWAAVPDREASFALIHGDSRCHAEMSYLTGFTPKVRSNMALVPREGEPVILLPGSRNSFSSAAKLTPFKNLDLLTDPAKAIDKWLAEHPGRARRAVLLGCASMRAQSYRQMLAAFPQAAPTDATPVLHSQMQRKRPREIAAIRRACEMLSAASAALTAAVKAKSGVTAAVLDAERAAHAMGAQDVKSLFSLDGGRTLRPFTEPIERVVDPLQVSLAVRYGGYWAEGLMLASSGEHASRERAQTVLKMVLAAIKPGASAKDLARVVKDAARPMVAHPVIGTRAGNGIGLSIEERPFLDAGGDAIVEAGQVYSIYAGASDGASHAALSAMVLVEAQGTEVLWKN